MEPAPAAVQRKAGEAGAGNAADDACIQGAGEEEWSGNVDGYTYEDKVTVPPNKPTKHR